MTLCSPCDFKAVPLHAMEALGGRGGVLLVLDLGTRWGWVVSDTPWPHFTPGERTLGYHWIGGWVGPGASMDAEARGKVLCPWQCICDVRYNLLICSLYALCTRMFKIWWSWRKLSKLWSRYRPKRIGSGNGATVGSSVRRLNLID
jgi:hypothetical protein